MKNFDDHPPDIQALYVEMGTLLLRHEHLCEKSDESGSDFYRSRIQCDFDYEEEGVRSVVSSIYEDYSSPDDDEFFLTYHMVVLAHIVASQRADEDGSLSLAWINISQGHYWAGKAAGLAFNPDPKTVRSEMARAAAARRHDETQKLKEEALEIWRKDVDPSLSNEQAAEFLRRRIPLKTRTLSRYVSEEKKKRSY